MKKRLQIILTGAMLALLAAGIAACKTDEGLSAPANLQVSEYDILTWDEVKDAKSYLVSIDGEEYETETNSLDIFLLTNQPKTYEIKVEAWNVRSSAQSEPLSYTVNDSQVLAYQPTDDGTGYKVKASDPNSIEGKVIVPSTYNGKPVKEIAKDGYKSNYAFENCKGLTGLILPDTIYQLPSRAFSQCINLRRIRLPSYVETIGIDTFYRCESLKEIGLPEGLRRIDNVAFTGCESLEKIEIPCSVEKIGIHIFDMCRNLKTVTVNEYNEDFWSEGNCIIRKADNALIAGCNASTIPQGVTAIEEYAFFNCRELKELDIPASVTKIGAGAFENCYALEKLELPNGLKELGTYAFRNCKSLKSLNIPRTVETINVGADCMFNGAGLLSLTVDKENPYYFSDGNCILRKSDGVLVAGCNASVIPDYVEEIGDGAFAGCRIKNLALPAGLKTIGSYAFAGCPFTQLYIPESVETIKAGAFTECALQSVVLPGSVKTIGVGALDGALNVYTSAEEDQAGWYRGDNDNFVFWCDISTRVWHGCTQKDDDGLLYVDSITFNTYQSYSPTVPTFDPYREGYIFKGWTTEEGGTEPLFERTLWVTKAEGERYVYLTPEQAATLPVGKNVLYAIWEKI